MSIDPKRVIERARALAAEANMRPDVIKSPLEIVIRAFAEAVNAELESPPEIQAVLGRLDEQLARHAEYVDRNTVAVRATEPAAPTNTDPEH